MNSRGAFLLLSTILFVCHIVSAQNPTGKLWGIVVDSANREPLIGATVIVHSPQDSITVISDSKGAFFISHIRDSLVTTDISYLGYKKYTQTFGIDPIRGSNIDTITLNPTVYMLNAAVIHGEKPFKRMSGDTLIFNAEAVPVLPGDETMILVNRIPGFKASKSGVTYAGKVIARTYVDGKPLFGKDASTALQYLEAHEVIDIQIYDELIDEDKASGFDSGQRQTVMSLITRSKPDKSINIRAEGGYGADIDKNTEGRHDSRYKASGEFRSFAVDKQFNISAETFNTNTGGAYSQTADASIGFSRTWNEKTTLNGNYHFRNYYNRAQSISQQVYFPSEEYQTRTYDDSSQLTGKNIDHNLSFLLERRGRSNFLTFKPSVSFSTQTLQSYRGALNTIDGEELNRVKTSQRNDTRSYNLSESLHWSKSFNKNRQKNTLHA